MRLLEEALVSRKPAVLLVALDLPGLGGPAGLRAVRRLSPSTKVVALSRRRDDREELDVLRTGAKGYVTTSNEAVLSKVVEKVQQGEIWAARKTIGTLFDELLTAESAVLRGETPSSTLQQKFEQLSPREREILRLLSDGASNKEIATALNVTVSTIKAHLTKIFRKLGQSDRLHLALAIADVQRTAR